MSSTTPPAKFLLHTLAILILAGLGAAQIEIKRDAVVLYGSEAACSQPATIDFKKVRDATPEWDTIKTDGVRKGSARYDLLIADMNARIKKAVTKVAQDKSKDCVVRKGDIKDAKGLTVADLTDSVIDEIET